MYLAEPAVIAVWQYHSHLWLLYCKMPLIITLSSTPSLQPLTLTPVLLAAGVQAQSTQSAESDCRLPTSNLSFVLACSGGLYQVGPEPNRPPSSCVNCLTLWCSSNLSRRYPPPPNHHHHHHLSSLLTLCTLSPRSFLLHLLITLCSVSRSQVPPRIALLLTLHLILFPAHFVCLFFLNLF